MHQTSVFEARSREKHFLYLCSLTEHISPFTMRRIRVSPFPHFPSSWTLIGRTTGHHKALRVFFFFAKCFIYICIYIYVYVCKQKPIPGNLALPFQKKKKERTVQQLCVLGATWKQWVWRQNAAFFFFLPLITTDARFSKTNKQTT